MPHIVLQTFSGNKAIYRGNGGSQVGWSHTRGLQPQDDEWEIEKLEMPGQIRKPLTSKQIQREASSFKSSTDRDGPWRPRHYARTVQKPVSTLAGILFMCEAAGRNTECFSSVKVVLIPKGDEGLRPINISKSLPRVHKRAW